MLEDLASYYGDLYHAEDPEEKEKITSLESNTYIPILDDPITEQDINEAFKDCKKGGYDYNLPVLGILTRNMLPMLILLFNCLFYLTYPIKLACSLLITIPKLGDLKLPSNFRGIQMLPAIGVLYDRIINKTTRTMGQHTR